MQTKYFIPGRIELLGKHVDYAGGSSLTCAIDRGLSVTVTPLLRPILRVISASRQNSIEMSLTGRDSAPAGDWSAYAHAVVRRLARDFPRITQGLCIEIASSLPESAGLSSSSAMIVAIATAIVNLNQLNKRQDWLKRIPNQLAQAEYFAALETGAPYFDLPGDEGVGVAGGAQDHIAILCSQAEHCGYFSYLPARIHRYVAWPKDYCFAVAVSGVAATKTGNAREQYNRTAESVRSLLGHFNAHNGSHHATLWAALEASPESVNTLRQIALGGTPEFPADYLVPRFEQFVEETRVTTPRAVSALDCGDFDEFGRQVARSQALAEMGLSNQLTETSALVRIANTNGAIASSAFGAGFGGSVWSMVRRSDAESFLTAWSNNYVRLFPEHIANSEFFLTYPSNPARSLP